LYSLVVVVVVVRSVVGAIRRVPPIDTELRVDLLQNSNLTLSFTRPDLTEKSNSPACHHLARMNFSR